MLLIKPQFYHKGNVTYSKQVFGTRLLDGEQTFKETKSTIKGKGLEEIGDKLDKLLVKPLKKAKNIKFNL